MAKLLVRLGAARVDKFESGVVALQAAWAGDQPLDVVITDLTMPDMGGCTLADHLRREHLAGVFIGATGHAPEEDLHAMLGAGMDEVIVEPVGDDALVRAIARSSAKRAASRAD